MWNIFRSHKMRFREFENLFTPPFVQNAYYFKYIKKLFDQFVTNVDDVHIKRHKKFKIYKRKYSMSYFSFEPHKRDQYISDITSSILLELVLRTSYTQYLIQETDAHKL